MRIEFLMCGSPTDAFWSQAAMFRIGLDALGEPYASARQVLCTGSTDPCGVPARWKPFFERIEVSWVDPDRFAVEGDAHCKQMYRAFDPRADVSVICDADTLLLQPFPAEFLRDAVEEPAIAAVIAHTPPPLTPYPDAETPPPPGHDELWDSLAREILGRPVSLEHSYTLARGRSFEHARCPFYVNHGLIVATPPMLAILAEQIEAILPQVRGVLDNDFCYQLAVAYAVERAGLRRRALPMRFNFPNDPLSDRLHPQELSHVILLHYLRRDHFDRHRIFAGAREFERFMHLPLTGSNALFRDAVRELTGGRYPFAP